MGIRVIKISQPKEQELAFEIRKKVFVEGQNVPFDHERDKYEDSSNHYLAYSDEIPCGAARWRLTHDNKIKLERFAVLDSFRGKGIGNALLKAVLKDLPPDKEVYLNAQVHVIEFYEKRGFVSDGPEFEEAGIMHRKMILRF